MEFIYKGLEAEFDHYTVTDEEVDTQMERLRQQTPKIHVVYDRPAQNGDELVLDYEGWSGEEQFPGGTAQYQTLTLGSRRFIPGFEEQLIGAKPGDKVDVNVTFPEEYHAPELAGKPAVFHCYVHEIRETGVYEMDDEFAKALGMENFDQMRAAVRESVQRFTDERGQMDLEDRLIRKAAQTMEFNPTQEELDKALDEQMETLSGQLGQQGLSLEMYCQFTGKSMDELREDQRGDARENLRIRLAIEKIVALENITVSEDEMASAVADVANQNNLTAEQMQEYVSEEFLAAVKRSVEVKKVLKLVRESAVLTERK
ncbi:MAG: trigger factor [Oscillospiraceae bacterium]|nr:trigger factor [Oscillospiraceae bacterium]